MDGEAEVTPRGRSQRIRRPPTAYQGALSWEEAARLDDVEISEDDYGENKEAMGEDENDSDEDVLGNGEEKERDDVEDSDDISLDDYDGNTSDEFIPDEETRPELNRRKGGDSKHQEDEFGSDSGEEFGSPDGIDDSEEGSSERGYTAVAEELGIDPDLLLQDSERATIERLKRAKKRTWLPPVGHGGLENPEAWKAAGQRNRQRQEEAREREGEEGEVEVEEDELQNLADAFSGSGKNATIAQVERWQSALHLRDQEPEDEELDELAFEQDLRGATGFKRKNIRGRDGIVRRAPREQAVSGPVSALLSEANIAFIEGDIALTIQKLEEVIRLEPAVRSAWATLALCFQEMDKTPQVLQCRIMEAHLTPRPIGLWAELAASSQAMGYNEQAIYCLSKAITSSREKDREDVLDIMWERSQLLEELDEPRRAAQSYLQMLQYRPQNQSVIRQLIPLLFRLGMLDRAIAILQKCEEWNMEAFPDPLLDPTMMDESIAPDVRNTYDSNEVVTLADLLLRAGQPQEALHTVRRGARWLDGRGFELFWNDITADDREFDESRDEAGRVGDYGRRVELAPIHYLDPEFRFQLAIARARLGDTKEAKRHIDLWRREADIVDQMDHYTELADEFLRLGNVEKGGDEMRKEWYEEALQITVELLAERQRTQEDTEGIISDYKRSAACYMGLNDSHQAAEWLKPVIDYNPEDFESMLRLAEAYEDMGERDSAFSLVTKLVQSKRERQTQDGAAGAGFVAAENALTQSLSFFAEIQSRSSRDGGEAASRQLRREQRKELETIRETEAKSSWKRLKELEKKVFVKNWWSVDVDFGGDDSRRRWYGNRESNQARSERLASISSWLLDAELLINQFQNTTQLYPRDRTKKFRGVFRTQKKKADMVDSQATAILARLGDEIFDEVGRKDTYEYSTFRGFKLDEWVNLIMQYAFVLTKVGEFETADEVINSVFKSSVIWTDDERKRSVQICHASCALYAQNYGRMFDILSFLTNEYQFHNEPLRIIFTLANSIGYPSLFVLNEQSSIKKYHRRIRIHDVIAQGGPCVFSRTNRRWVAKVKLTKEGKAINRIDEESEGEDEEADEGEGGKGRQGEEEEEEEEQDQLEEDDDDDDDNDDNNDLQQEGYTPAPLGKTEFAASSMKAIDTWQELKEEADADAVKHTPPTRDNPANDCFYGSLLLTSSNGVPSMAYFLRTFARQQNDALICLTAAIACFGRAQNRQVDNRHQVIIQGFAFLDHYRQLRKDQDQNQSEINYNFGRAFHLLGLYQLAVPHYLEVLDLHERQESQKINEKKKKNKKQTGFKAWPEAAYNLAQIYLISGNPILANQVMERYLRV